MWSRCFQPPPGILVAFKGRRCQQTTPQEASCTQWQRTHHVSWLLNFFVTTFPSSSPSRSATFWDRSWWELPLKSTMFGMSGNPTRRVREERRKTLFNERLPHWRVMETERKWLANVAGWALLWCGGGDGSSEEMCQLRCQLLSKESRYWLESLESPDDVTVQFA